METTICLIRGTPCKKTPEESVRQHLLSILITQLGYPQALCAIEISLKSLLADSSAPFRTLSSLRRRIDVAFFLSRAEDVQQPSPYLLSGFIPFILFECKAKRKSKNDLYARVLGNYDPVVIASQENSPDLSSVLQLMGYAHRIGVPYFGLVEDKTVILYERGIILYAGGIEGMPSWQDLCARFGLTLQ